MNAEGGTPRVGAVARVRTRSWLIEDVANDASGRPEIVSLACLDDDAQGDRLEVVWPLELDTRIIDREAWQAIGDKGFDHPRLFGAFLRTLRWNCVTATDPALFQSPFRAGIRLDAYQLEPLAKALRLPRVNMFIADDVGLGKTIEAGLIASELLLRRRVRDIVVACPPSMLAQWKDELETRFGLTFEILDRAYVDRVRRERGFAVNPWTTFPRFLVSHRLLIDEAYAGPLRDWLDNLRPGSLLILDEAHHAAPASGGRYAIDSKITRAIRDLASRFEHRLFLSATPHNGHSNSFSALLELLDPHRFTRGVKVLKSNLDAVMVRRIKDDVREIVGGFPKRVVRQVDIAGLPEDAPELALSRLLNDYREVRLQRVSTGTRRLQSEAMLMISGLQQRLLSSVEAFARTLRVHYRSMERIWAREAEAATATRHGPLLLSGTVDADDELADLEEADLQQIVDDAMTSATEATAGDEARADAASERRLLDEMLRIADEHRSRPDARVQRLIAWLKEQLCAGIHMPNGPCETPDATWSPRRVLIFTEYDDTKRYLLEMLRSALRGTSQADQRIAVYHGPTPPPEREALKRAFNAPPEENPLRILIATDAAREGLNLQAHCNELFHFDLPWNPGRLEQRNGRIDRKLQLQPVVYCHYFVYAQRPEDRVLHALVRKTDVIREQLGSLAHVLEGRLAEVIRAGIRHEAADGLIAEIEGMQGDAEGLDTVAEELEQSRERQDDLRQQIDRLRNGIARARRWIGLDNEHLRDALSCSLEMQGVHGLTAADTPAGQPQRFVMPDLDQRYGADPTWSSTLATLRQPVEPTQRFQSGLAPLRPVVFDAPESIDTRIVQLHLEHRVVKRLLGRFLAQGFVHHDLSRAVLASSTDAIPRVVLLGRIALYGPGAVRLHEEILTVTARWVDPANRRAELTPFAREAEARTLELLEDSLAPAALRDVPEAVQQRLQEGLARDLSEMLPHLVERAIAAESSARELLETRSRIESESMRKILEDQRRRVSGALDRQVQFDLFGFNEEEKRQLASDRRYWVSWLANVEGDLEREPERIRDFYRTVSARVEPVGLAYLWPVTG
ncbi:MAG: DEAD/DEAH box helicase [Acidobacteria bacterium]|nr:DEAD/DEAH box helicase [Acidobacteriota bacterium]